MPNKYLNFREGFLSTSAIDRVVSLIDPFFKDCPSYLTSGLRTETDQLRIIVNKSIEFGFHADQQEHIKNSESFSSPEIKIEFDGQTVYWWQPIWSKLLNVGFIVNPPIKSKCLMDYWSKRTGENMRDKEIDVSMHSKGLAFDIGGGKDLNRVAKCVMHAKQGTEDQIQSYLVERVNNAIHINCKPL